MGIKNLIDRLGSNKQKKNENCDIVYRGEILPDICLTIEDLRLSTEEYPSIMEKSNMNNHIFLCVPLPSMERVTGKSFKEQGLVA